MKVEITITINAIEERFDKQELVLDIKHQFVDITGYQIDSIDVFEVED
jgi:hypothetical protein